VRQFPQKNNERPLETIGCTLLGIWYVPYLLNFVTRLLFALDRGEPAVSATGRTMVLFLVVTVKMSDVGAFAFGHLLGRHKLFPRISPAKTWEGLIGGVGVAVVASFLFCRAAGWNLGRVAVGPWDALALGVLLSLVGGVGDLFESLLKRASDTKDSSSIIPGMGGILDILDSLLFGAPVLYTYTVLALQ
jgi:phosphatidate cytidylyltransferase